MTSLVIIKIFHFYKEIFHPYFVSPFTFFFFCFTDFVQNFPSTMNLPQFITLISVLITTIACNAEEFLVHSTKYRLDQTDKALSSIKNFEVVNINAQHQVMFIMENIENLRRDLEQANKKAKEDRIAFETEYKNALTEYQKYHKYEISCINSESLLVIACLLGFSCTVIWGFLKIKRYWTEHKKSIKEFTNFIVHSID